jgi:hypothetical protein
MLNLMLRLKSFKLSVTNSTTRGFHTGNIGSISCVSVCLASYNPYTFHNWQKLFLHLFKILWEFECRSSPTFFTNLVLGCWLSLNLFVPHNKSSTLLLILFASSSLILTFRYSLRLFLKCLLVSKLHNEELRSFYSSPVIIRMIK